jgi:hypothetical protein
MMFSTFAEQRHFEYPEKGTYRGVVINANMVQHAPAGLAAFLLEKTAQAVYVIDPLTHAFQHDPEAICNAEGEPRASIRGLAEVYGRPIDTLVGARRLLPKHLKAARVLDGFTDRCVAFQRESLRSYMRNADTAKYLDDHEVDLPPYAIVAPYFYLTETTCVDWLPVCVAAAERARELVPPGGDSKLFAAVLVSQGVLLDESIQDSITDGLSRASPDGYLLWADNLDEQTASKPELAGLLRFARRLRKAGRREVVNLHGGYFSILAAGVLGKSALSGVTHAPEFGEFRPAVPVGGGIPIARYYVPPLHARVRFKDAAPMFRAAGYLQSAAVFHENVCACEVCKQVLANDANNFALFGDSTVKSVRRRHGIVRIDFPTTEAKMRCLRHYLQRKRVEYQFAATASKEQLVADLGNGITSFVDVAGLEGVAHLQRWMDTLTS